jgi:arylsulfatase A-like enzyme
MRAIKKRKILPILIMLSLLAIIAQCVFSIIHYKTNGIMNVVVDSSLPHYLFLPVIILPVLQYLFVSFALYAFLIAWIWFISISFESYWLGLLLWFVMAIGIVAANSYYYPHSFFALPIPPILLISVSIVALMTIITLTIIAGYIAQQQSKHRILACILLLIICVVFIEQIGGFTTFEEARLQTKQPNIIVIGLDSIRPDFLSYNQGIASTKTIDNFLKHASVFSQAYTPLARTYPSWVSLLTAKYPIHNKARNNLAQPDSIVANDSLAKELHKAGYETLYASDEKRFSNITTDYGFDDVIGPRMGLNDFLLGGLNDFPLNNLMINSPLGKYLFPYNYGNRSAAITYEPNSFLNLVDARLDKHGTKPLFLAIHLCLAHWPFISAKDEIDLDHQPLIKNYQKSIEKLDQQLGQLFSLLQKKKLLNNTIVVLVSDHGSALGLLGDQNIKPSTYVGDAKNLRVLEAERLSNSDPSNADNKDYTISTSYGYGSSLIGLVQNHVLFAIRGYGVNIPHRDIPQRVSLLDVTPTILDILHLTAINQSDGISLLPHIEQPNNLISDRDYYFETGDKVAEIETDHISIAKTLSARINVYDVDRNTGHIFLKPDAEKSLISFKQRAVMWKDWYMIVYPPEKRNQMAFKNGKIKTSILEVSPYVLLLNLKTSQWCIGFNNPLAKQAPLEVLKKKLHTFYGDEIPANLLNNDAIPVLT